jgi:hypothetical protein
MILYSQTLETFRKRVKRKIKQILLEECFTLEIKVLQKRFQFQGYYYPIEVICFERDQLLGYFDSGYYTIGIHRNLAMLGEQQEEILNNIIRHEVAHYLCFILYGRQIKDHGVEYRELCKKFGWDENVYSAKLKVDQDLLSLDVQKNNAILEKVKKLLSLAQSQNEHESQMATLKANELLQKHHLNRTQIDKDSNEHDDEQEMVCRTVWQGKRNNTKMLCISELLGQFLVFPYFNYGKNEVRLEVMGKREQVEIADYLCKYYQNEFEALWKKQGDLKGKRQKNSFFRGLCQGHLDQIKNANQQSPHQSALVVLNQELQLLVKKYLPQVGAKAHNYSNDSNAQKRGLQSGKDLKIRKGINQGLDKIKRLGFFNG